MRKSRLPLPGPLASLLLFLGLLVVGLFPLFGRVNEQARQFIDNRAALASFKIWERDRPLCETRHRALVRKVGEAGLNEPKDRQIAQLFETLSRRAAESGVRFTRVKPGSESLKQGICRLAVQVTALSGFHQMGLFMNRLEQGDRPVHVTGFQLKAPRLDDPLLEAVVDLEGVFVLTRDEP